MKRKGLRFCLLILFVIFGVCCQGCLSLFEPDKQPEPIPQNDVATATNSEKPTIAIVYALTSQNYQPKQPFADKELGDITTVGSALAAMLEGKGVHVINDTTVHDRPTFSQAYENTLETVAILQEIHPEIQLTLDLHRDAIPKSQTQSSTTVTLPDGETAARILFVVNKDDEEIMQSNLEIAQFLSNHVNQLVPELSRGVRVIDKHAPPDEQTAPSLMLVIGDYHKNNITEAEKATVFLGEALAAWLQKTKN